MKPVRWVAFAHLSWTRFRCWNVIAFITQAVAVRGILAHLSEATSPPRRAPAGGPPVWEMPDAGQGKFDPQVQQAPDYEFDQRIAWA